MRHRVFALLTLVSVASATANAQSIADRIKARAKEKAAQMAEQKTDSLTEAALNKGAAVVKCVIGDKACIKKANDEGKTVVVTDKKGQPLPDQPAAAPATPAPPSESAADARPTAPPGAGVWLNYDFIPGERTIWLEDFEGNDVGDFPRRLRLIEGNLEVVKVDGKPMLRSEKGGKFLVKLPEKLPERFTVEIRFHSPMANPINVATTTGVYERSSTMNCFVDKAQVLAHSSGGPDESGTAVEGGESNPGYVLCAFTVDNGKGIKGYIDQTRTANAPQTHVVLTDSLYFETPATSAGDPMLIESIRVAAGGKKLYEVLNAAGRVSTHGILFDNNSAVIRGESTPTLKEIGDMLAAHADLKLLVEGHTDNVGQPAANLSLSSRRADAVVQYLVQNAGIDASRLTSKGFGATKPAGPNSTPEGRQNNRRVELVKQ